MDNVSNTEIKFSKEDYNAEPVFYCKHCLSLNIRILNENLDFCDDCGNTVMEVTDIESWEKLYKEKYNNTLI